MSHVPGVDPMHMRTRMRWLPVGHTTKSLSEPQRLFIYNLYKAHTSLRRTPAQAVLHTVFCLVAKVQLGAIDAIPCVYPPTFYQLALLVQHVQHGSPDVLLTQQHPVINVRNAGGLQVSACISSVRHRKATKLRV
jgi:hypothetical protein